MYPLRLAYIVLILASKFLRRLTLKFYRLPRTGLAVFFSAKSIIPSIEHGHIVDLLKAAVILSTSYFLSFIDPSILYHSIRGQSMVKLYVIFNVCEVADKLLCSFGLDIMNSLLAPSEVPPNGVQQQTPISSPTLRKSSTHSSTVLPTSPTGRAPATSSVRHLKPITYFLLAVLYTFLHSMVLFYQVITLNVAINSYNNALLTLLLSNQFVEIKGSVFKKFEKDNLFQLSCSGILEALEFFKLI